MQAHFTIKKVDVPKFLAVHGLVHCFELPGTTGLRRATRELSMQNTDLGEPVGAWTSIVVDRKKTPTVLFAFHDETDAVRAKLILVEHMT